LVTGAAAAAYDDLPWIPSLQAFIQTVHENYSFVRIYGSCFGHQLIAQALLAGQECSMGDSPSKISVEPSVFGHEIGVHPIILDPEFSSRFSSFAQFSQERPLQLQLIHGDIVTPSQDIPPSPERLNLPDPWINLGSSEKCLIQGLYYPGRVLTLQGHFEFDAFASGELCRQFSRTYNWPAFKLKSHLESIWGSSQAIDGPAGPYDDSKALAEMALLFFADEDRPSEE
jgi:GMP synthase-like glutamine amidotransferase